MVKKKTPAKKTAKKPAKKSAKKIAGLVHYDDQLQPFLLDGSNIRGRMVRLGPVVDTILQRHNYPDAVSRLLAELLVLSSMLAVNLKAEGILTIQAKGDGPVKFMVVDATDKGSLRGYVDITEGGDEKIKAMKSPNLADIFGKGYLAITLDMGGAEGRYQGIVELASSTFTDAIAHYFTQSQQVDVSVKVAVGQQADAKGKLHWRAGGIMIERLPDEASFPEVPAQKITKGKKPNKKAPLPTREELEEYWRRACIFMESARASELLDPHLPSGTLLFRLFNEDGVWIFDPKPINANCRCTRERISQILASLPKEELPTLLTEGKLRIQCQFCNKAEVFTEKQVMALKTSS